MKTKRRNRISNPSPGPNLDKCDPSSGISHSLDPNLDKFDAFKTAANMNRIVFLRTFPYKEICPICLNDMFNYSSIVYPCGHAVHYKCDMKLRRSPCNTNCPTCRRCLVRTSNDEEFESLLSEFQTVV